MRQEKKISTDKRYSFPSEIEIVRYHQKYLIISVNTACWIVAENEKQLYFFNLLRENTIGRSLELFNGESEDAIWIITQIEARQFDSLDTVPVKEKTCMIYLTSACNLRCPHCYLSAGQAQEGELSTSEIKQLLKSLSEEGIKELTFSGGEICIRQDLIEILSYAKGLSFETKLLTNGTLWTQSMIDDVAKLVSSVQISIDGFSEAENSKIRGIGNFAKALTTLERFLSHNISVQLAVTPFPEAGLANKIEEYAKFGIELNAKYEHKDFKILFTTGIMDGRNLTLSNEEREQYKTIMQTVTAKYLGEEATDYPFILTHKSRKIMDNCSYGCLYIWSNGDVYMCSRSGLTPIANIRTNSLESIMEFSRIANKSSNVNNLLSCKNCCLKYICGGGCRVVEFDAFKKGPALLSKEPIRDCSKEQKEYFYDLMIRTNKSIFS